MIRAMAAGSVVWDLALRRSRVVTARLPLPRRGEGRGEGTSWQQQGTTSHRALGLGKLVTINEQERVTGSEPGSGERKMAREDEPSIHEQGVGRVRLKRVDLDDAVAVLE